MNKLLTKIVGVALGATMAVGVGVAAVKASDGGIQRAEAATTTTNFTLSSADSASKDGVTVSFDKASGSNAPAWYAAGLRLYPKNTVTFTCANNITALSLNWEKQGSKAFITDVTSDVGTYTHPSSAGTGTWSGSATTIVLTLNSTAGQLQLNTFSVTHESSGGDTPTDPTETIKEMDGKVWYIKAGSYYLGNDVSSSATASGVTTQSSAKKLLFTLASEDDTYYITDADDSTKYLNCTATNGANVRLNTTKCTWVLTEKTLGDDTPGSYTLTHTTNNKILTCYESKPDWRIYNAGSTSNRNADLDFEEYTEPSETYTVSFNANGGTGSMSDVTDVYGNYKLPDCSFTYSGKEFAGWKANNSGDLIDAGATYNVDADVTFYAQWSDLYNVTYAAGTYGTGSFVDSNKLAGTYTLLAFSSLTGVSANNGYKFKNYTVGGINKNPGETITLSANTTVTVNFEEKGLTATYDFVTNFATYASSWGGYANHVVTGADLDADYGATITFTEASKQSGTITDRPVVRARLGVTSKMTFVLDSSVSATYNIGNLVIEFAQWGSKKVGADLYKGTLVEGTPIDGFEETEAPRSLTTSNLNDSSFVVNFTQTADSNNQLGITSISITLVAKPEFGTLDHIKMASAPTKTIYHVGDTFDSTGLSVFAYDNADETIAVSKDVSALVSCSLDGHEFLATDVPGLNAEVTYTEGLVTADPVSFAVKVYDFAEYEPVTEAPDSWTGTYIIVGSLSEETQVALNGALDDIDVLNNFNEVVVDETGALASTDCEFTFVQTNDNTITIQAENGKYVAPATGDSNGIRYSDSAVELTIGFDEENVLTIGNGTRNLLLNNNSGQERFRFLKSAQAISLYKSAEEPSGASAFADLFLETLSTGTDAVCDAQGETVLEDLVNAWGDLATAYGQLSPEDKATLVGATASETGTNIEKAVALYDYIAKKYNTRLQTQTLTDYNFMGRSSANASNSINPINKVNNTVAIVVVVTISLISVSALGAYFLLRKKKEER